MHITYAGNQFEMCEEQDPDFLFQKNLPGP